MYARGATIPEIAAAIGKSERTIARWKSGDDVDWDRRRDERRRKDPHALLAILEQRRDEIARDDSVEAGHWADAIFKLQRVIDSLRREIGDISLILSVLEAQAEWARQNASDADRAALLRIDDGYTAELRRKAR